MKRQNELNEVHIALLKCVTNGSALYTRVSNGFPERAPDVWSERLWLKTKGSLCCLAKWQTEQWKETSSLGNKYVYYWSNWRFYLTNDQTYSVMYKMEAV